MAKKKTSTKVKKLVNYYSENVTTLNEVNKEQANKDVNLKKATAFGTSTGIGAGTALALFNNSNPKDKLKLWAQIVQTKQAQLQAAKNAAEADKLRKELEVVQNAMPKSVFQIISAHPLTHVGAFAAGYGTKGLKDRFDRRVLKKGLDSDTNITGGLFNFGKQKNKEISYLNKRLNKNILSKFMSFDSDDNRKLNYNHPILQNDPDLLVMINSLISDTRSLGKYYTSERDLARLRKKINQVERYIYDKYPKLFYSNGNNGETTDLRSYLNKNQKVPMDYIPDMASALNQEKDLVDKKLEPGKWRKRLQKWIS